MLLNEKIQDMKTKIRIRKTQKLANKAQKTKEKIFQN